MNSDCTLDFETPIRSGKGDGVTEDGRVDACLVQRAWLRAWCAEHPAEDYRVLLSKPIPDNHPTISPVLQRFAISLNDGLPDEARQLLRRYEARLLGTKADQATELRRSWMAFDWLVRTFTPTWLRKAKLDDLAAEIEALPALTSTELAEQALPVIGRARQGAAAVGAAAWDAAGAAAGDAAWDAAWAAVGAAAWAAVGAAAWDAVWAAAGDEAKYRAARNAADEVLRGAFDETIAELRASALRLLDDMIELTPAAAR